MLTRSSKWKWPDVPGMQDFEGSLIHTASWPEGFDCKGLRVAVIGNGASGVQILPAIRPGKLIQFLKSIAPSQMSDRGAQM